MIVWFTGLLSLVLLSVAVADENGRKCFNEYEALAAIRIKAEVSLDVPELKYREVNRFNSANLGVFIPSSHMKAVFTRKYPETAFVIYMSGNCASGLVAMLREDYSKITGIPYE